MKNILLVFAFLVPGMTIADAPLRAPTTIKIQSDNAEVEVISDPKNGTTAFGKHRQRLWHINGWFRDSYAANDGAYFISGYSGLGLLPQNYDDNLTLITFWKNGRAIKKVSAAEIIPDKKILQPTVSHYYWGLQWGWTPNSISPFYAQIKSNLSLTSLRVS